MERVSKLVGFRGGSQGELGTYEKKWNVDVVLVEAEYDPCITMYGAREVDAAALTTLDALKPTLSRPGVVVGPTSTSYGGDAVIVLNKYKTVDDLVGVTVRGLEQSVSQYVWARGLEVQGKDPAKFIYKNMDPGAAALAMQQGDSNTPAIVVWNPFVGETIRKVGDKVHILFDSTKIPGEIIDSIVIARDSLGKPGGADFAHALLDAYYAVNRDLANPATRNDTLVAIGQKFSGLNAEQMEDVVNRTRFYSTPESGISCWTGGAVLAGVSNETIQEVTPRVVNFALTYGILSPDRMPKVTFGKRTIASDNDTTLLFDPSYMQVVANSQ